MKRFLLITFIGLLSSHFAFSQNINFETDEEYYSAKEKSFSIILGDMYELVYHAIIPFDVGGSVDMYLFPQTTGVAMVTMELLRKDGDIPLRSRIGTYEFIAFSKYDVASNEAKAIIYKMNNIFTVLGNYSTEAVLNPFETCEIPTENENICIIFDEYPTNNQFNFDGKKHGLLLIIEVFQDEMNFAMKYGTRNLLRLLKEKGFYPFSDLDRESVIAQ